MCAVIIATGSDDSFEPESSDTFTIRSFSIWNRKWETFLSFDNAEQRDKYYHRLINHIPPSRRAFYSKGDQ